MKNNRTTRHLCLLLLAGLSSYVLADDEIGTAFSSSLFDGVHVIDVRASTQAWVDSLGEKQSIGKAAPVQILENSRSLSDAVDSDSFELGVISATELLQIAHPEKLEPRYVLGNGGALQSLLLLVRSDSGITSLAQLRNKDIFLPENRYASLTAYWLDTLLMEGQLAPSKEHFFSAIKTHEKATCVVLPVFFDKCDACIVSDKTFKLMCELNPQIGNKLTPLEMSPPYLCSLVCFRTEGDPELKRKLGIAVSTLHESIGGAQVLMSFHSDKYVEFQPGQLDNTASLLRRYKTLKAGYDAK